MFDACLLGNGFCGGFSFGAPAAASPAPMPHVAPTPRSSEALHDGPAAAVTLPPHLEPLLAVVPDAPPAYLAHLLELAGGDVGFAITMHFDGGGVVPHEWRAAAEATRPAVEEAAPAGARRSPDDDAQLRWRGAARATTLRRPATVEGAMGHEEVEHHSWLLSELPPAQQWAPTSGGGGSGGGGGGGSGGTPHDTGRPGVAGDAAALLLFVEQVRHRDRRLRALAAASAEAHSEGAGEAWRRAHEIGALRDLKLWSALSPDAAGLEAETFAGAAGAAGADWAAGGGGSGGEEGGSVLLVPRAQLPAHVGVTIRLDLGAYLGGGGGGGGGGSVGRLRLQLCVRDGAAGVARAQARRQMGWIAGCRRVWHALPTRSPYRPCACHVICMHGMGVVCA